MATAVATPIVIPIYFEGRLKFRSQSTSKPMCRVEVPEGSHLLPMKGAGDDLLFVPSPRDPMQLWAHWPAQVLTAAREGKDGFRLVD